MWHHTRWQGRGGVKESWNSSEIIYGWPPRQNKMEKQAVEREGRKRLKDVLCSRGNDRNERWIYSYDKEWINAWMNIENFPHGKEFSSLQRIFCSPKYFKLFLLLMIIFYRLLCLASSAVMSRFLIIWSVSKIGCHPLYFHPSSSRTYILFGMRVPFTLHKCPSHYSCLFF